MLTPPIKYAIVILKCFSSFWCVIPLLLIGAYMSTRALFCWFDNEINPQIRGRHVRLGNIEASARPMAAFSGFYESNIPPPLGDVHGLVPAHRHGHWNGQQRGGILHRRFVDCRPGGRRGNTEWVVAWWRRPVASGVALCMLHLAMRFVLHRNGRQMRWFVFHCWFLFQHKHSLITSYSNIN